MNGFEIEINPLFYLALTNKEINWHYVFCKLQKLQNKLQKYVVLF